MPKLSELTGGAPSKLKLSDLVAPSPGTEAPAPKDAALEDARKATAGDELGGALYQGATLGFGKDIDAGGAYVTTAAKNALTRAKGETPKYGAKEAAEATKQAEREKQDKFGKEHPVGKLAADLGGALLTPGLGAATRGLETLGLSPAVRAVLMGGALGGAGAAGEADGSPVERLSAVPGGVVTGGLTGGALHGAMSLPGVVRRGAGALQEALDRYKIGRDFDRTGEISPEARAKGEKVGKDYVARLAKKADPTGEKLRENAAEKAGKPVTAAEALGRESRGQLKVMGRRSGQTGETLESQLFQRNQETGDRVVKDFADVAGVDPETITETQQAHADRLRGQAGADYEAWHAHEKVDNTDLRKLVRRPAIKEALTRAANYIRNKGGNPFEMGVEDKLPLMRMTPEGPKPIVKPDGTPHMVPSADAIDSAKAMGFEHPDAEAGPTRLPTARAWDYVKRELDGLLEQFRDKHTKKLDLSSQEAQGILEARKALAEALTDPDTPWGKDAAKAFKAGGDPIRMEEAFRSAKELLSNNLNEAAFKTRMKALKDDPAQLAALKAGIVAHARDLANAGRLRLNDLTSKLAETKLKAIFGDEAGAELVARMKMEAEMKAKGARMRPDIGSDTSETMIGKGEQDEAMGSAERGLKAMKHTITGNVAGFINDFLAKPAMGLVHGAQTPINEAARDVAGALLSGTPSELAKVLEDHGASKAEAKKITDYLSESGLFEHLKEAVEQAGAQTAGRRTGEASNPPIEIDINRSTDPEHLAWRESQGLPAN